MSTVPQTVNLEGDLASALIETTLLVPIERHNLFAFLPRGGIGGEVGVATGGFARIIYDIAAPTKMHLIDLWESQSLEEYPEDGFNQTSEFHRLNYNNTTNLFSSEISEEKVQIHKGRSVERAADFPDEHFDWIHIDANHTYEGAYQDLVAYLPKLKSNGLLFCHDFTNNNSVKQFEFGVVPAVKDFCKKFGCAPVVITAPEEFPTVVIAKNPRSENVIGLLASLVYHLKGIVHVRDFLNRDFQHIHFPYSDGRHSYVLSI